MTSHPASMNLWTPPDRLPLGFQLTCRRCVARPTRYVLWVRLGAQRMGLFEQSSPGRAGTFPRYQRIREFVVSTSRFGIGEVANSNCTPRGLHCIARKVGGGWPVGTVFKSRLPIGYTWQGLPNASIAHRIFWLAGLEPGFNQGGAVDTFRRFIYIHGFGDESTLGRPASHGCVHVAAAELMPLYDALPEGTLVWISGQYGL